MIRRRRRHWLFVLEPGPTKHKSVDSHNERLDVTNRRDRGTLSGGAGVAVGGGTHVVYACGSGCVGESGPLRGEKFVDSINGDVSIVDVEDSAGALKCPGVGGMDGEGKGASGALLGGGGRGALLGRGTSGALLGRGAKCAWVGKGASGALLGRGGPFGRGETT